MQLEAILEPGRDPKPAAPTPREEAENGRFAEALEREARRDDAPKAREPEAPHLEGRRETPDAPTAPEAEASPENDAVHPVTPDRAAPPASEVTPEPEITAPEAARVAGPESKPLLLPGTAPLASEGDGPDTAASAPLLPRSPSGKGAAAAAASHQAGIPAANLGGGAKEVTSPVPLGDPSASETTPAPETSLADSAAKAAEPGPTENMPALEVAQKARFDRLRALADAASPSATSAAAATGKSSPLTEEALAPERAPVVTAPTTTTSAESSNRAAAATESPPEAQPIESPTSSSTGNETRGESRQQQRGDNESTTENAPPIFEGGARPVVVEGATASTRFEPASPLTPADGAKATTVTTGASRATPAEGRLDAATVDRVHDQLRLQLSPRRPEMTVRLDPPELGRLHVKLSLEQGTLVARIETERAEVARAFDADVGRLIRTLEEAGLKVGAVDVRQEAAAEDRSGDFARSFDRDAPQQRSDGSGREAGARGERDDGGASAEETNPESSAALRRETDASGRERALDLVI